MQRTTVIAHVICVFSCAHVSYIQYVNVIIGQWHSPALHLLPLSLVLSSLFPNLSFSFLSAPICPSFLPLILPPLSPSLLSFPSSPSLLFSFLFPFVPSLCPGISVPPCVFSLFCPPPSPSSQCLLHDAAPGGPPTAPAADALLGRRCS